MKIYEYILNSQNLKNSKLEKSAKQAAKNAEIKKQQQEAKKKKNEK